MFAPEQLVSEEWAEWYRLTPVQRWLESEKLWQSYLALGGSLDPEPDTQSPFFDARAPRSRPHHGRRGGRILRRSRVSRDTDFSVLAPLHGSRTLSSGTYFLEQIEESIKSSQLF